MGDFTDTWELGMGFETVLMIVIWRYSQVWQLKGIRDSWLCSDVEFFFGSDVWNSEDVDILFSRQDDDFHRFLQLQNRAMLSLNKYSKK